MCVQDKWERWTWDKELPLCCCLLIKGLFNPFIIITHSNYCMHLISGPGSEIMKNANWQCAHLAHYVQCWCAYTCNRLVLSSLALSSTYAGLPVSPWLTSKRNPPTPSKTAILPFCLWLIGCGLIPSLLQPVPIVSRSQREACGWKTDSLSKVNAWRGWISTNWTIIHLQLPAATCILLREGRMER